MKIYFAASIRGGRENADIYPHIIQALSKMGHTVLSEHFGDQSIDANKGTGGSSKHIYQTDMSWIEEAELIVAEVTNPSLGVGYEIGRAEQMKKRIVCLFNENSDISLSAMIDGNPHLEVIRYVDSHDLSQKLESGL